MPSLTFSVFDAFADVRASGLARPAAEKFAGAWLACFLVMARGNQLGLAIFESLVVLADFMLCERDAGPRRSYRQSGLAAPWVENGNSCRVQFRACASRLGLRDGRRGGNHCPPRTDGPDD
jgi:hypothetical protein